MRALSMKRPRPLVFENLKEFEDVGFDRASDTGGKKSSHRSTASIDRSNADVDALGKDYGALHGTKGPGNVLGNKQLNNGVVIASQKSVIQAAAFSLGNPVLCPKGDMVDSSSAQDSQIGMQHAVQNSQAVKGIESDKSLIVELTNKLRDAEWKIQELDEELFNSKAESMCKFAEEKYGKSFLIQKLESQLSIKQCELEESDRALNESNELLKKERNRFKIFQDNKLKQKAETEKAIAWGNGKAKTLATQKRPPLLKNTVVDRTIKYSNQRHHGHTVENTRHRDDGRDLALPAWLSRKDLASLTRVALSHNAHQFAEKKLDNILRDELSLRVSRLRSAQVCQATGHNDIHCLLVDMVDDMLLLLRILCKYFFHHPKLTLDDEFVGNVLVGLYEKLLESTIGENACVQPEKILRCTLIDILIDLAYRTLTPCAIGKRIYFSVVKSLGLRRHQECKDVESQKTTRQQAADGSSAHIVNSGDGNLLIDEEPKIGSLCACRLLTSDQLDVKYAEKRSETQTIDLLAIISTTCVQESSDLFEVVDLFRCDLDEFGCMSYLSTQQLEWNKAVLKLCISLYSASPKLMLETNKNSNHHVRLIEVLGCLETAFPEAGYLADAILKSLNT